MRKLVLSVLGASALAIASAASAQTIITPGAPAPPNDPMTSFIVSGNIFSGPIAATIGHTGIVGDPETGAFTDIFQFTIPQNGVGSGSITTSVNFADFGGSTDLDIISVVVNGLTAFRALSTAFGDPTNPFPGTPVSCTDRTVGTCGANEAFFRNDVPIISGALNTITVTGIARGNGSYGGNLTFSPAPVPEPATWAMMLFGFAGIGWQLRRTRRTGAIAQLA